MFVPAHRGLRLGNMDFLDLSHTPLEWILFAAAAAGLVLAKIYIHSKRRELEADSSRHE